MKDHLRGKLRLLLAALSIVGLGSEAARADAMYSIVNLGSADPNASYLPALSAADQAAFKAGSFDVYAHPSTLSQGQVPGYNNPISNDYVLGGSMVTSNNLGVNAGTMGVQLQYWSGWETTYAAIYTPRSPTLAGGLSQVNTFGLDNYGSAFYGNVAGINDHGILAMNVDQLLTNRTNNPSPWLKCSDYSGPFAAGQNLGSLGGTDGMAAALNNSNQVVGWSQLANGVQHAFVYSNGTMQDLNLEIPPASGIVLTNAVGIDGSGRIMAFETDSSGTTSEFLLTPNAVPEPTTLAFVCLCVVALAAKSRLSPCLPRP